MEGVINEYFAAEPSKQPSLARVLAEHVRSPGILALVKALQSQLTGNDENVRADATQLLALVLQTLPIQNDQTTVLWTFFCDRITDGKSFIPGIHGLQAIKYVGDISHLRQTIEQASFRRQPQLARHEGFLYLQILVNSQLDVLDLYLDMASGEKDPQNLLLTLKMAGTILSKLELSSEQKEELFDVTFCYFPITFKPPKDMHYKIDVEEIKALLRKAISSPVLAEHVIPGLIGKLNAVNPDIKADVLFTLNQVVRSYPDEILNAYWLPVWDSLKFEILHGSPENTANGAVFEILQRLTAIPELVDAMCADIAKIDPAKKALATQICLLVVGVANSQSLFSRLSQPALDVLFMDQKVGNIEYINILLGTRYHIPSHNDEILSLMLSGLSSQDYYPLAATGLPPLAVHAPEFVPVIIQGLVQHLPDSKAISAIANIARVSSAPVISDCLPGLFSKIGDEFTPTTRTALQVMGKIAVTKDIVNAITIRLCSRAQQVDDSLYLFEILSTLLFSIKSLPLQELSRYYKYIYPMLPLFFNSSPKPAFLRDIVIDRMSLIMEITVRALPGNQQNEYAEEICRLIWPENSCVFGNSPSNMSFLMTGCLVGVDETNLPSRFQISFVQYSDILKRSNQVFQRAGYLRYLALGVNKWPQRFGDINLAVKWLRTSIETGQDAISNLEILSWLCKGLLMRNDNLGFEIAEYLTKLLDSKPLGSYSARVFGVLITDDRVLSKENRVIVRLLYKQRLFLQVLPQLLQGFNSSDSDLKLNCMTALSSLVRFSPSKVLQEHLDEVMPVMLACLDPKLANVLQSSALTTIASTIPNEGSMVLYEPSLEHIINSCLVLSTSSGDSTTRSKSTEVLYLLAVHMPRSIMKAFSGTILKQLPTALADGTRDVRKQASKCLQAYHIL